jgi:phosphoglycerate dehydrogenase-like enzyme
MKSLNKQNKIIICFISDIPENVREYIKMGVGDLTNVKFIFPTDYSEKNIMKLIKNAHVLIGWRPTLELLLQAEKMKVFINPGAGIHHLLSMFKEINKKKKVILINGHGNSYFVAQHAVALLLSFMNRILEHHNWMKEGKWRTGDEDAASIPLRFRKIGLLGYGAINKKVHKMLSGFNVSFSVLRRSWSDNMSGFPTKIDKYVYFQLDEFLKKIDIVIIAVPVTNLTKNMIDKENLELLGSDGILINVSRGEVVNQRALYYSLKERKILGAAIDVWYNYDPESDEEGRKFPYDYPFHDLNNIILSPHRGYSPFSDLLRWNEVIENIKRIAHNRDDLLNMVDLKNGY